MLKIIDLQDVEVGQLIFVATVYNYGVFGYVLGKGEHIIDCENGKQKYIDMRVSEDEWRSISEHDISDIVICNKEYDTKILKDILEKYGIECFDNDQNIKEGSVIINEMLVKQVWNKLSEEEKIQFAGIVADKETVIELTNALDMSIRSNDEISKKLSELSDERIRCAHAVIDFIENHIKIKNQIPEQFRSAFNYIYQFSGVENLINTITGATTDGGK